MNLEPLHRVSRWYHYDSLVKCKDARLVPIYPAYIRLYIICFFFATKKGSKFTFLHFLGSSQWYQGLRRCKTFLNFTLFYIVLHSRDFPRFSLHFLRTVPDFGTNRKFVLRDPHTGNNKPSLTRVYLYIKNRKIS